MHGDEVSELGRDSRVWIGKRAHDVTRMVKYSMVVTLTLHDHVMHDDTTNPHVTVSCGTLVVGRSRAALRLLPSRAACRFPLQPVCILVRCFEMSTRAHSCDWSLHQSCWTTRANMVIIKLWYKPISPKCDNLSSIETISRIRMDTLEWGCGCKWREGGMVKEGYHSCPSSLGERSKQRIHERGWTFGELKHAQQSCVEAPYSPFSFIVYPFMSSVCPIIFLFVFVHHLKWVCVCVCVCVWMSMLWKGEENVRENP